MDRFIRRRVVAGLLGLLALSLSLAEAGVASLCDPSMPMQGGAEVGMSHSDDAVVPVAVAAHRSDADTLDLSEEGMEPPPCPWMPVMGAGCTAPVVAPAVSKGVGTVDDCADAAFRTVRNLATLHSSDPLLPPPRA